MAKDVEVLDLVLADRLLLGFKRGLLTREAVCLKLVSDAGIPEHLIEQAIIETEQTSLAELERRVSE